MSLDFAFRPNPTQNTKVQADILLWPLLCYQAAVSIATEKTPGINKC